MPYLCAYAPDFLLQAALRAQPHLRNQPFALLEGTGALQVVVALSSGARKLGLAEGMTRLQAKSVNAALLPRTPAWEEAAQQALLSSLRKISPRVEDTSPGVVIADVSGLMRIFGSQHKIAGKVVRSAQEENLTVQVAIGSAPESARLAALGFAGITILPSGKEAERLASLHLEILSPPPEMAELLADWGIRTLGALAELPPIALSARLGQEGLRLQQLARGETDQLLIPCEEPPVFLERCELEEALENLEPLCFLLHRMLQQLLGRLAEHSLATQELHLRFELATYPDRQLQEPALGKKISLFERILKLPVPTLDCAALFKLLQLDLAEHPPSQPVQKIEMQALPARMRAAQGNIFLPTAPQPEKLEVMLARIRAVVGEGRVGSAKLLDTHQPDAFVVAPFGSGAEQTSPPKLLMAYRRFRPPRPIALESAGGRITRIRLGRRVRPVRAFSGPWRSSGTWWEPSARWQREEWELSLANPAGLYRIFQDSESQQWFAEGMYD